jgi:hypothetical protein
MNFEDQLFSELDAAARRRLTIPPVRRRRRLRIPLAPVTAAAAVVLAFVVFAPRGHEGKPSPAATGRFSFLDSPITAYDREFQRSMTRQERTLVTDTHAPPGAPRVRLSALHVTHRIDGGTVLVARNSAGEPCLFIVSPAGGGTSQCGGSVVATAHRAHGVIVGLIPDGVKTVSAVRADGTTKHYGVGDNVFLVQDLDDTVAAVRWTEDGRPVSLDVDLGTPLERVGTVGGLASLKARGDTWYLNLKDPIGPVSVWLRTPVGDEQRLHNDVPTATPGLDARVQLTLRVPGDLSRFSVLEVRRGTHGRVLFRGAVPGISSSSPLDDVLAALGPAGTRVTLPEKFRGGRVRDTVGRGVRDAVEVMPPPGTKPNYPGANTRWLVVPGSGGVCTIMGSASGCPQPLENFVRIGTSMFAGNVRGHSEYYGIAPAGYSQAQVLTGSGQVLAQTPIVGDTYRVVLPRVYRTSADLTLQIVRPDGSATIVYQP